MGVDALDFQTGFFDDYGSVYNSHNYDYSGSKLMPD
jgi:hypothetical protein